MKRLVLLTALGILFLSAGADGQNVYLGPQVGFFKSSDGDNTNMYAGGSLRLKLSPGFAVEGSIGYRKEQYADDAITVKNWPIMATGMVYLVPLIYGAAGIGWYNTTIEYDTQLLGITLADDRETRRDVGWHFGGGVELPLGTSGALTGDIRYVFLNYEFNSIPGRDVNSNFYIISAALLFGL